jgi:hypothetical protein
MTAPGLLGELAGKHLPCNNMALKTRALFLLNSLSFFCLAFLYPLQVAAGQIPAPSGTGKPRLAVAPVIMALGIKSLKEIGETSSNPIDKSEENKQIEEHVKEVETDITSGLIDLLDKSGRFEIAAAPGLGPSMCLGPKFKFPKKLPVDRIDVSPSGRDCDLVMVCKISGYGKVKKEWAYLLVGSGVGEGIVHGAIALKATASGFVAAGALLAEVVSEALKWGGGSYLFGKKFSPVILEAAVYDVPSGNLIYKTVVFAVAKKNFLKMSQTA